MLVSSAGPRRVVEERRENTMKGINLKTATKILNIFLRSLIAFVSVHEVRRYTIKTPAALIQTDLIGTGLGKSNQALEANSITPNKRKRTKRKPRRKNSKADKCS